MFVFPHGLTTTFSHFQLIAQMLILSFDSSCAALELNTPGREKVTANVWKACECFMQKRKKKKAEEKKKKPLKS